jgi:hypothetical protein
MTYWFSGIDLESFAGVRMPVALVFAQLMFPSYGGDNGDRLKYTELSAKVVDKDLMKVA